MRRLILAALALTACAAALPSIASAQDVRAERRAEIRQRAAQRTDEQRQRAAERRAEMLQRLQERRPELKQRIDRRLAEGRPVRPMIRKMRMQRLKLRRPDDFNRLDLNQDGRLQRQELRQRARRIGRA